MLNENAAWCPASALVKEETEELLAFLNQRGCLVVRATGGILVMKVDRENEALQV